MMMKRQQIAKLESQLEGLIEGTFATLFGSQIQTHDIALRLARAMEDEALPPQDRDPRHIAPNHYIIILHPEVQRALIAKVPALASMLAEHLVELATQSGYRLSESPQVTFMTDSLFLRNQFSVQASHTAAHKNSSTAIMKSVRIPKPEHPITLVAYLMINDQHIQPLKLDVVNIGRHKDNHIIINDPMVSRYHVQIRRRMDEHIIFNAQSKSGTYVNGVQIREHRLKSGDVIRIGHTQMVYMIDGHAAHHPEDDVDDSTGAMSPLE